MLEYRNRGFESANVVVVPALVGRWRRARADVRDQRRAADDHRSHPDRRQHADRSARDQARAAAAGGQAARPRGLAESQRRLGALGLFRRFRIEELSHGGPRRRTCSSPSRKPRRRPSGMAAAWRSRGGCSLAPAARPRNGSTSRRAVSSTWDAATSGGRIDPSTCIRGSALHPEPRRPGPTGLAGFGLARTRWSAPTANRGRSV